MRKLPIVCILFLLGYNGYSQNNSSLAYTTLADSLYRHHSYHNSAIYYEKALKKATKPEQLMLRLATCYTAMNKMQEADQWFQKAKASHAQFTNADTYQYAHILMMLKKRKEAAEELKALIKSDPQSAMARQLLDDVLHYKKYYKDSARYNVQPLNINTNLAEFSPTFYKDGIVFSSAQPQDFTRKKYHWDNTHFLSLYYSVRIDDYYFKAPVEFDKKLDSRFHDGPAVFYQNDEHMIINRNEQHVLGTKKGTSSIWHLSLYDAVRTGDKKEWQFTLLPFNEAPYSFAHPSISADGNVLYFVSNKPGGYGGNDIYSVRRKGGVWSAPFNVGPAINTEGDEEFPFFTNGVLYFSSTGHGGMGGLDIFKSSQGVNGFSAPINLGYPVNSNFDDLSIVLKTDEASGYFSSARNGNDDLFAVRKQPNIILMQARFYDHKTKLPLAGATVQLVTDAGETLSLLSDSTGQISFELPEGTTYALVGTKDNKVGTLSGEARKDQDKDHTLHTIEAHSEATGVTCIGTIKNEKGLFDEPVSIIITDVTTDKVIDAHEQQNPLVNFQGEKGHTYSVQVINEDGRSTFQTVTLSDDEDNTKTWTITLPDKILNMNMAAHIFNANDNTSLSGAAVKIMTFSDADQELVANADGVIEFTLPFGTAYILVASKGDLTGMLSGIAEAGKEKASIVHPVPAQGDPLNPLYVFGLVTNAKGDLLDDAHITVTDKATGEKIPTEIKDGILTFFAERGKEYVIQAERDGYETFTDEIKIPEQATTLEKLAILLQNKKPTLMAMAARVFKAENKEALAGAQIKIMSFTEDDIDTYADEHGRVNFTMSEGSAYVIVGSKDGYTGMHSGIAEMGTDTLSIIHPIPAEGDQHHTAVAGEILNKDGELLTNATVTVTDVVTGKEISVQYQKGILAFTGEPGKTYTVTVQDQDYTNTSEQFTLPTPREILEKISIVLERKFKPLPTHDPVNEHVTSLPITATLANKQGTPLTNASVTIIDDSNGNSVPYQLKEGVLSFAGEEGKTYTTQVKHVGYTTSSEKISIPLTASKTDTVNIQLTATEPLILTMAARIFKAENNEPLGSAAIRIITFTETDAELIANEQGVVEFNLPEGTPYVIMGNKDKYAGTTSGTVEKGVNKGSIIHPIPANHDAENPVVIVRQITNQQGKLSEHATVTVTDIPTGKTVPSTFNNGLVIFNGKDGNAYTIIVKDKNQSATSEVITILANDKLDKGSIIVPKKSSAIVSSGKVLPGDATLIMQGSDTNNNGLYLMSEGSSFEIVEEDGMLYLQHDQNKKLLGKGSLKDIRKDPQGFMTEQGFASDDVITLDNIYFDYNTAVLDETDKAELKKVITLLHQYPALKLHINAHTDDRGKEDFNLTLSKKRAKAIGDYLGQDVKAQVILTALGESTPAVPCSTPGCSEEEHQKNRRAEFSLYYKNGSETKSASVVSSQATLAENIDNTYDDKTFDGLYFKVSIGAYRYNHSLTFDMLNNLGKVESELSKGIMYYYLSGAVTLKQIKKLRIKVIRKGINDAAIVIFYRDKKISVEEFKTLLSK